MAAVIYQKQGRLRVTLDTEQDLSTMHKVQIIYKTPSGSEVTLDGIVVGTTKITAYISPLEDESGMFTFHAAVTVQQGDEPILGRALLLPVSPKWKNAINVLS